MSRRTVSSVKVGKQPVERVMRSDSVEAVERLAKLQLLRGERRAGLRLGELGSRLDIAREAGSFGCREASPELFLHGLDARDVGVGVEAEPARRALRSQEVVAAFPRTQQLRAHTDPAAQLSDA